MEASGSSSYSAAIEETIALDEDPDPHLCCGQWAIGTVSCVNADALMDLPGLALA
jgi:hypothetical protein